MQAYIVLLLLLFINHISMMKFNPIAIIQYVASFTNLSISIIFKAQRLAHGNKNYMHHEV